jgi:hypothetical protein
MLVAYMVLFGFSVLPIVYNMMLTFVVVFGELCGKFSSSSFSKTSTCGVRNTVRWIALYFVGYAALMSS